MYYELFHTKAQTTPLELDHERALIASAQSRSFGAPKAMMGLLRQYAGTLQSAARIVRTRVAGMTREQIEDLESDLVLVALEAIQAFNLQTHIRLAQTLPAVLARKAAEMATALTIPRGVLARWFRILRAANGDTGLAVAMSADLGMSPDTFRAIKFALDFGDADWEAMPYAGGRVVADSETYRLAQKGLALLAPAEREVIELAYGFRGDPKADSEVADIVERPRNTVKFQRTRALDKMRQGLTKETT